MTIDGDSASSSFTLSTTLSTSLRPSSIRVDHANGVYTGPIYASQSSSKLFKKFHFCVCSERSLEIHESEKSFRKKKRPKWIVDLASVYSITKRSNDKLPVFVSLINPEQTFFLRALDDQTTHEWHDLVFDHVQTSRSLVLGRSIHRKDFPNAAWDVTVNQRPRFARNPTSQQLNLCTKEKRAVGPKRLCFFDHSVVLLQMHCEPGELGRQSDNDHDVENPNEYFFFPRSFISFYGSQRKFFFIRVSTPSFGACEVFMDCGDPSTATEIYDKFRALVPAEEPDFPWTLDESNENENDTPKTDGPIESTSRRSSRSNRQNPSVHLPAAKSYCDEKAAVKKREDEEMGEDEQAVPAPVCPESSAEDGDIGKAIVQDMVRMGTKKCIGVGVPKKFNSPPAHSAFHGLLATLRRPFRSKTRNQLVVSDEDLAPVVEWAENRISLGSAEETEDSGGTLKADDGSSSSPSDHSLVPLVVTAENRRDDLLTTAILQRHELRQKEKEKEVEEIEMDVLQRSTDSSVTASTGSYAGSVDSEESAPADCEHLKQCPIGASSSSTSALDDLSASSSNSNLNVPVVRKPKRATRRRTSPAAHSCSGRYTTTAYEDTTSDGDSCYSSLSTNGYHALLPSIHNELGTDETTEIVEEVPEKTPSDRRISKEPEAPCPPTIKQTKSSTDLQQMVTEVDPRERAASLGNKKWNEVSFKGTPQAGGVSHESCAEYAPLLAANRHASISSRSDCSAARKNAVRAARLSTALLRKHPAAFKSEDLAEVDFAQAVGGSRGSMESHPSENGGHRETVNSGFDSANKHLIPTTRYSGGSSSSASSKARRVQKRHHRQVKGYDLEPVRCFLAADTLVESSPSEGTAAPSVSSSRNRTPVAQPKASSSKKAPVHEKPLQRADRTTGEPSTSSRESGGEPHRCRHGRVKQPTAPHPHRRHGPGTPPDEEPSEAETPKVRAHHHSTRKHRCNRHSAARETIAEEADELQQLPSAAPHTPLVISA